jgi:hypothetical protein
MNKRTLSRLLALLLCSAALGAIISHDMWRKHLMGKSGFLQYEGRFFDKSIAPIAHPFLSVAGYLIFIAVLLAIYELTAFVLAKLFGSRSEQ